MATDKPQEYDHMSNMKFTILIPTVFLLMAAGCTKKTKPQSPQQFDENKLGSTTTDQPQKADQKALTQTQPLPASTTKSDETKKQVAALILALKSGLSKKRLTAARELSRLGPAGKVEVLPHPCPERPTDIARGIMALAPSAKYGRIYFCNPDKLSKMSHELHHLHRVWNEQVPKLHAEIDVRPM
jgi:hypothetical protein